MNGTGTGTVRRIFRGTAATYDAFVERSTQGLDSRWKRQIFSRVESPRRVLDLASGTGIVSYALARRWPECRVTGIELQPEYARMARERVVPADVRARVRFRCEAAEEADLPERSFDYVVTSYLPKYADLERLVPRIAQWLEPGGRLIFHDFTCPEDPVALSAWTDAFDKLRRECDPEWETMMRELPDIIRASTWVADSARLLREHGFEKIEVEPLSMGCAALVTAVAGGTRSRSGADPDHAAGGSLTAGGALLLQALSIVF